MYSLFVHIEAAVVVVVAVFSYSFSFNPLWHIVLHCFINPAVGVIWRQSDYVKAICQSHKITYVSFYFCICVA